MSDEFDTSSDDNGGQQNTGKGLRAQLEAALAELASAKQQLTDLQSKESERAVRAAWDELKVPERIRKLYNGDTSPDAIKAWWGESQSLFNIEQAEQQPAEHQPSPEELAQRAAAQQFQEASSLGTNGIHSGVDAALSKAQEIRSKGTGATQADLDALTELMGIPKF